jgi:hypothetical protein
MRRSTGFPGADLPNNSVDTIPVRRTSSAPACVIDCSREAAENPDYLLTVDDVLGWEARHGRIPPKAWVLMRTDWSKRTDPVDYQNYDETGQHTPGPGCERPCSSSSSSADVIWLRHPRRSAPMPGQGFHLRPPNPVPLLHAWCRALRRCSGLLQPDSSPPHRRGADLPCSL